MGVKRKKLGSSGVENDIYKSVLLQSLYPAVGPTSAAHKSTLPLPCFAEFALYQEPWILI